CSPVEQVLVFRHERLAEAQDLEAVAITDGPELYIEIGAGAVTVTLLDNDKPGPTGDLIHGSVDALGPAARRGKNLSPDSPGLPVRKLSRMQRIADVKHPQAAILEAASHHPRIRGIVEDATLFAVVGRPRDRRQVRSGRRSGHVRRRLKLQRRAIGGE